MDKILEQIHDAIMEGEAQEVKELTEKALVAELAPQDILQTGLIEGMRAVGEKFKNAQVWIPDVLMASRAMHAGLYVLKPVLKNFSNQNKAFGKIVIGTVAGDLHDIGKNMVTMMLQGAGVEVIDIGIDVPVEAFVKAVREHQPNILGISALLTTTMPEMSIVIDKLKSEGLREQVKVIVGGGPVTAEFANAIGADGYAVDAIAAVDATMRLLEE